MGSFPVVGGYFFDGVTDGRNPRGELFGHERLHRALLRGRGKGGQLICEAALGALRKFQLEAPQEDDITFLAIHRE